MTPMWTGRFTNGSNRVLDLALRAALAEGKNYIEPKHIDAALNRYRAETA
jgi:AAA+ superfamily predicted ATPase